MKKCAHCGVEIHAQSTMVERDGQTYCCNNCARAAQQKQALFHPLRKRTPRLACAACAFAGSRAGIYLPPL